MFYFRRLMPCCNDLDFRIGMVFCLSDIFSQIGVIDIIGITSDGNYLFRAGCAGLKKLLNGYTCCKIS